MSNAETSLAFSVSSRRIAAPFFRNTAELKLLQRLVRDRLLDVLSPSRPLRVWVPQCAGGEDAYSVAICLIETLGSRWREIPLYVFCTDSDEEALARARAGRYPEGAGRGLTRARLSRFFISEHNRIKVRPFLRSATRFAIHHPAQQPPFSRVDLIVCRETLTTMPPGVRNGALQTYFSTLAPDGVLLDPSGNASGSGELFAPAGRGKFYVARNVPAALPRPAGQSRGGNIPAHDDRLRESEEKFRALFSQSDDAIMIIDAKTDFILEANEAAVRLHGWSLSEFLAMRRKDLLAAPGALGGGKANRRSEDLPPMPHYRRKDGTLFPADTSTAYFMRQGRACVLWLVRDCTQRLQLNTGRKRAEEQQSYLGDVVHELRSPIAIIRSSAETLRRGVRGARARVTLLEFIRNHTIRMAGLVDSLLDLSVTDSHKRVTYPAPVALAQALGALAATFLPIAKRRGVSLIVGIPMDLRVLMDPADLSHIFGNLLDNAIKFTPRGGKVDLYGRAEGGEGIVSVRDTGSGIAPEDLSRVFERFFRAESSRHKKGTGLGLAIVHGIVKANQGRILAENDPAGGTIFHVALPLAPENP